MYLINVPSYKLPRCVKEFLQKKDAEYIAYSLERPEVKDPLKMLISFLKLGQRVEFRPVRYDFTKATKLIERRVCERGSFLNELYHRSGRSRAPWKGFSKPVPNGSDELTPYYVLQTFDHIALLNYKQIIVLPRICGTYVRVIPSGSNTAKPRKKTNRAQTVHREYVFAIAVVTRSLRRFVRGYPVARLSNLATRQYLTSCN